MYQSKILIDRKKNGALKIQSSVKMTLINTWSCQPLIFFFVLHASKCAFTIREQCRNQIRCENIGWPCSFHIIIWVCFTEHNWFNAMLPGLSTKNKKSGCCGFFLLHFLFFCLWLCAGVCRRYILLAIWEYVIKKQIDFIVNLAWLMLILWHIKSDFIYYFGWWWSIYSYLYIHT